MTTDAERNQQLLNELADLSTPEHFGRSLLLSITKHAAARKNPAEPFELTATIKVFPAGPRWSGRTSATASATSTPSAA